MSFDLSAYEVTGANNPAKQVSVDRWNQLLAAIEAGFNGGVINPHWFGVLPTNSASGNVAAWNAMMAALRAASSVATSPDFYRTFGHIRFPDDKTYSFDAVLDIEGSIIVEGCGPATRYSGTRLQWANGSGGFNIDYGNSATSGTGGTWTAIRNFVLDGGYSSGAEGDYDAISSSDRLVVERCTIKNWGRDGVRIVANSPTGNANNGNIAFNYFENCRTGLRIDGADANNITSINNAYSVCREFGEWRTETLGGVSIMPQAEDCGITSKNNGTTVPASVVFHSGHRYYVKPGQAAGASTNAPSGTTADNSWWGYLNSLAQDFLPAWSNGISVREGGSYKVDNANAASTYINPYTEGGQVPAYFSTRTVIIGGQIETGLIGSGAWLRNAAGVATLDYLDVLTRLRANGPEHTLGLTSGSTVQNIDLNLAYTNAGGTVWWKKYNAAGTLVSTDGYFFCTNAVGMVINGQAVGVTLRVAGTDRAVASATGFDLPYAGAEYRVNGTKVLGARGAALPADATDLASAITLVNAIKARMKVTGGHGLVAD